MPRSIDSLLDKIRAADHRNYGDLDALEEALEVAQAAGEALGRLGEAARGAVPVLVALMKDNRDPYLHQAAAFGLWEIGAQAEDSAAEIVGLLLEEEDGKASAFLGEALGRISALGRTDDPVVPAILEAFGDEEKRVRVSGALAGIAKRDKVIFDMLSGLLDDKDPQARIRAAGVLSLMGKPGRRAGPRLRRALRDDDPRVRETAFLALSHMELLDAKGYVKEIARCLIQEEDQRAAANQRNLLKGRRDELKNLAAELLRGLESSDSGLSFKAALALARADHRSDAAARFLWMTLAGENAEGLLPALEVLGEMARYEGFPLDAVPPTAKLLADHDPALRRAAVKVLHTMTSGGRLPPRDRPFLDKPGARKVLVSREAMRGIRLCVKDEDWEVVNGAVYLLGRLGEDAAAALPELLSVLDKPHESTPHGAVSELQKLVLRIIPGMGTRARKAVPHIVPFLSDESWVLRSGAAEALGELRSAAGAAVPALVTALDRDDGFNYERVRDDYAKALAATGEAEGLDRVRRLLVDEQEKTGVKEAAIDGLGESESDAAVDLLIEALGFSSDQLGYRIIWRLGDTSNPKALEALKSLADRSTSPGTSLKKAIRKLEDSEVRGMGTPESPWLVGSSGHAYRDEASDPPALVVVDYNTEVRYHLQCLEDLHEMLKSHGDWMKFGTADEQEPAAEGTVEAWARSSNNPVRGWYGLTEGERGRFARYIAPVMVALKLAEVEEKRRPTGHLIRALSALSASSIFPYTCS